MRSSRRVEAAAVGDEFAEVVLVFAVFVGGCEDCWGFVEAVVLVGGAAVEGPVEDAG